MKKLDFLPNLRNRYSIRRFTVGTASILIGSLLFLGHSGEAKAAENINDNNTVVEASNDSSSTQQAPVENNKTSLEKTKETPSTEAEPVKSEATVEKASEPVTENKKEATESVVTPATEPAVEKAVETVTETPLLSPEQKVEKVKADLSNDYDSAKVDAVLAVIDTTDLTPEQLKSEVLRLLLEEASAQKDLFSPQATLPRTGEEASGYSTRAFDLEEVASQEIVVTKENFDEYFKMLKDATYDSQNGVVTLTTNEANKSGAMSLDVKLNLTKDFSFSGAVNLGDKYEGHPKDGVTGGEGLAITFNPGKTDTIGLTGQGFGIGGESFSFGFKLDTFVNMTNDDVNKAYSDINIFENKGAFGSFIYTTDTGQVNTVLLTTNGTGDAALLKEQPNNQLVPFKFNYNGTTKVMTITYGTQTWTQNMTDYINYSHKDSFAFSIVASTTDHYNLQQVKLDEFRFTASAILDEYFIDDDTEEAIDKPLRSAGDVKETITLKDHTEYLAEKGYEFGDIKVRNDNNANGFDEGAGTVTLENDAQQLVYTVVDIQAPKIADVTDVTTNVSEAIAPIALDITDNSGHFDTITVTGLPTGLSFNETTKQITGTPTTPGDATVEVTATDMAGNTTTKTFKISVAGAQAPTITPINAQTGEAYTPITPIAVNVEGDLNPAPTVTVTGLPAGLSFDAATKQITGTPTAEGTFNVTVTAKQEKSEPGTSTFSITVQPNAALKELKAAVADAATVNKDSYTPKSVEAYEAKVTAGDTLAGQPENGSNAQFTDASKAIKDAKNALVPRADKAGLNQSITTAEALQPLEAGDPEDDALKTALATAKTVQGDLNADQPAVNKAKTDLDNAIAVKNSQDETDKEDALEELRQTLEYAEALNPTLYTTSSNKALAEAVTNAKTILGSPGSKTIAEIKAATNALEDAQEVLVPQADKTTLKTAINTANGYNNLNPNNPVDKTLQDKLAAANAVDANGDATADQVKTATDDLNNAITAKKAQDDQIAKDAAAKKAALDALNNELKKVQGLDKATYTPNTVTPLTEKQTAAQAIADAPDTKTTEEINAATKALKDAQDALVPKANKADLNNSVKTAETLPLNPADTEDKAVQDALDKAKTVQADDNATQDAVNTAQTNLDNAVNTKKDQDAKDAQDAAAKQAALDALNDELNKVKALDKATFTPDTVTPLTEKQTAAQAIADAPDTKTTEEIINATKALKDAKDALVPKADKTDLQKALDTATAITGLEPTDKEDKAVQDAINAAQTVNKDDNATPQQVADATKAINDAVAAKVHQDALDELQKAIDDAKTVKKDDYKPNTVTPFDAAVTAGETTKDDATKSVEEIKAATKAITDAQNKLELKANKEELNKVVKTTEALELNPADKEDKAVQDALNTAKEVQADQNASQETVDKAKTDLENAVNAKTTQDKVDAFNKALDALKAELEKVKTIDKDFYTPNSVKPVNDAETAGQTIVNNSTGKTVEEINKATQDLKEAQKHLVEKADKVELDKVIDTAENTDLNVNDKEDKAVKDALEKAITVQEDYNATQEEVDKAQSDLAKALETKATQDKADQVNAALEVLKKELEKVASIDKYAYTPNSVEPLTKAETAGQTIVNNSTDKTVEEINKATQDLKEAQKHLVEKADKVELDKVIDTAENTDLNVNDKEDKAVKDALDKAITVQEDFNATQEEVDKAQSDLAKALETKATQDKADQVNAALEVLKKELEKVASIDKYAYTPNSVEPLTKAETAGQTIVNNSTDKTVEEINKATQDLKEAQKHLVEKADKVELDKVIDTAENTDLNVNDKEDKAVKDALDKAITVQEDFNATQEEVDKAQSDLAKALENKAAQDKADQEKVQAFNKALEALKAQLAKSRTVVKDNFTPNSVAPFEEAQAVAQGIVNNPESVTVEQVVKATEVLKSTQSSLVSKADKSELEKVIKTAEGLDLNVTDKKDKAVKDALDTAVTVQKDQNVTQESVNKATSELEKAIQNKVAQDKVDAFNKALEALKAQLAKSRTVVKDNFTPNSVVPFEEAQAVAQGIVNNPESVTVEQVVKATEVLKSTQSSLITKADKTELEKMIKTAEDLDLNVTDKEDKAVKDALDTAVTVEADQNATQESVDKAQSDLAKALETKAAQDKADAVAKAKADALAELEKALDEAKAVDKSKYTTESVEKLDEAVVDGKVIVEKVDNVSVQAIKEATKAVETALNGLEKVKAPAKETGKTTEPKSETVKTDVKSDAKAQDKQTSKATKVTKAGENKAKAGKAGKNKAKALPETGQDVSSIDPQYASLMFAIGGLMMFFRKRKNEDKDNTEK
ncbi:hypothetical protein BU038_01725 [Staphylococcus simulans]|uniref:lectin-like domain-containing protein n=1 Tax=Staphylococcus simulans TaxID=1286 RepID=UPI000D1ED45F|nr:putative Ig domain-containing protein [Staphylococcus simulans]PTJ20400.1 hypothetical protein BU038_01725 [Staphylococcus simulans]